jgi:uncharacterized protein (TIGR03083 family)
MSDWNAMTHAGKDNLLRVLRREAAAMFEMASTPGAWEETTAAAPWEVRDIVGHMVDTTEEYLRAFGASPEEDGGRTAYGLPGMAARVDEQARSFRATSQGELMARLQGAFDELMTVFEGLDDEAWSGRTAHHFYMGPLPAFLYPVFQLMDYGVHSWDIRQGKGRAHGLAADTADLLAPFMMILWQSTAAAAADDPYQVGIKICSGPNACDYKVNVGAEGLAYEAGDVEDLPVVLEFDPASLVLTAFGRINGGSYRGDPVLADRFLNAFFRI